MTTLFRHILACLLVLSIPVQGFAASRMQFCATAHHSQAASHSEQLPAEKMHHATPHDVSHAGSHAEMTHSTEHKKHETGSHNSVAHFTEQCPACDLCCNVFAVPPTNTLFSQLPSIEVFLQTYQLAFFGPSLEGPKRPPRATLA
jgi:hypothetical protein